VQPRLPAYRPLSPEGLLDPHRHWARARERAPVFFAPDLGGWLVTRREDVLRVLADPATFSSAGNLSMPAPPACVRDRLPHGYPWATPTLANGDPPEHTRLRKLVNAAFSRTRIRRLEPRVEQIASEIVARLPAHGSADDTRPVRAGPPQGAAHDGVPPAHGSADAIADLAMPLAERSLALAIGYPESELDALRAWLQALDTTNAHAADPDSPALVAAAEVHARFAERITALIHTAGDGDDLLALLARAEPGLVTPVRAQSAVMQVVMAGVATTAHTIAHSLWALLRVPSRWEDLRERPAGVPAAVEEGLRHRSTVRGMPRTATRDVEIAGVRIVAGERVWVLFASANRDSAFVADAEVYVPDREDGHGHVAFGRGRHFCPGAPLARAETEAALRALLPLAGLRLADDEPLTPHPTFAIDALVRLPIRW
jgi:cytochrome P450